MAVALWRKDTKAQTGGLGSGLVRLLIEKIAQTLYNKAVEVNAKYKDSVFSFLENYRLNLKHFTC